VPSFLCNFSISFAVNVIRGVRRVTRTGMKSMRKSNIRINVTLGRVPPTIVAVEKPCVLHILNMCVFVCVCVCVALGTQHEMRMRNIVICGPLHSTLFFNIFS
jgi:hypothetical protein